MNALPSFAKLVQWAACLGATLALIFSPPLRAQEAKPKPGSPAPAETMTKQTYTYKHAAGCDIKADVYQIDSREVRPILLWIHGGALIMGDRQGIRHEQLDLYLKAGFTVVSIDYRLAPETKLKEIIEDLKDAHRWIRERGPDLFKADPDRIAVAGHSAGGYLTLMAGFCLEPRPRALVPFYGYGDIIGDWYSKPDEFYSRRPPVSKERAYAVVGTKALSEKPPRERSEFYLYCRQQGLWPNEVAGMDPAKDPRAFDPFCPARNVTKEYPPTLLLHGDKDTDVPHEQSAQMAQELARHGVRHEFISLKNRGHGFDGGGAALKDPEIAEAFARVLAFLKANTRPREVP